MDHSDKIDEILANVLDPNFSIQLEKQQQYKIGQDVEDDFRLLKNVCTDFVVNEFFSSKTTLYSFLKLIYSIFDQILKKYKEIHNIKADKIFFLYKGGNILRIVLSEFLLDLPASASNDINEFYKPYIKRSDHDFTIYIHPQLENYDQIYKDISIISYMLQVYIVELFSHDMTTYFDFPKYNKKYQHKILEKYKDQFIDSLPIDKKNIGVKNIAIHKTYLYKTDEKFYERNKDVAIQYLYDDFYIKINGKTEINMERDAITSNIIYHNNINPDYDILRITANDALDFLNAPKTKRINFNLTRTKIVFNILLNNNEKIITGGELIDVSISHRNDDILQHFFDHLQENIKLYTMSFENNSFKFISYDIKYLIDDLQRILFIDSNKPWDDAKYAKRINRLFYLLFVDIFIRVSDAENRLQVLQDIRTLIFIPMTQLSNNKKSSQQFTKSVDLFIDKYYDIGLYINSMAVFLTNIANTITKNKNNELLHEIFEESNNDIVEFIKMGELLITNVDVVMKTVRNIKQYCSIDGRVKTTDLITGNIAQLL